ncbi:hypothetical protein GCM10010406_06270 [Streptomyces thermolineatus]|uniref:Uncharacterized protein n=1 Tax=Streptomyces thermolineatus TaxID=44033 RepID=A0ABN3KW79_9ACTN
MFDYEMHRIRAEELQRCAAERRLAQQARRDRRRPAAGSGTTAGARGRTARRRGSAG